MKVCAIPAGTGGVSFYRIKQPLRSLQKLGHDVFIFDPEIHDGNRLHEQQKYADIIIYQCPWSQGIYETTKLIYEGKAFGNNKKVVIELDDNLFDVDPWNEKYNLFGTEEKYVTVKDDDPEVQKRFIDNSKEFDWMRNTKHKDGSITFDMWRDGHGDFSLKENRTKYLSTLKLLNIVDLITITTPELGKQFRKLAPKTKMAILPNYIDFERWLPMEKNESDEIRIGWQGGSAHFDDLRLIINDLIAIHKKYNSGEKKKVRFCFMGVQFDSLFQSFEDQTDYFPWHGDIETYPLLVREMKLDIALAPLRNTVFNRGKSPLKWCEYSALNIPTIASDIVYGDYIKHGKTGLVAREGEWFKHIDELIQDKEKRLMLAEKAFDRVTFKYNQNSSSLWLSALKDIL